jgi:hypothetical protein
MKINDTLLWKIEFPTGIYLHSKAIKKINRKFRVPRKQGAYFLGARAQIQDSWDFSSSA